MSYLLPFPTDQHNQYNEEACALEAVKGQLVMCSDMYQGVTPTASFRSSSFLTFTNE